MCRSVRFRDIGVVAAMHEMGDPVRAEFIGVG